MGRVAGSHEGCHGVGGGVLGWSGACAVPPQRFFLIFKFKNAEFYAFLLQNTTCGQKLEHLLRCKTHSPTPVNGQHPDKGK